MWQRGLSKCGRTSRSMFRLSVQHPRRPRRACEDPLTVTQLEFFISVAKQLQPFLLKFQTDALMAPFLGQSFKDLLLTLEGRIIKKDPLVRYLSSLNPPKMISSASDVTAKFEKILQILMNGSWCSAGECDELLSQYNAFLVQMKHDHAVDFREFTPDSR